jgi:hypothetical protein
MVALIKARRDEHLANIEMVNAQDQFEIIMTKVKMNIHNYNEWCLFTTHAHQSCLQR